MQTETCNRCGRPVQYRCPEKDDTLHVERVSVVHDYYGCESGCCGHTVIGMDCEGRRIFRHFDFDHPCREHPRDFALRLARRWFPTLTEDDIEYGGVNANC
jgi:hypothetical protein